MFRSPFSPKKAPPRKATTISPLQMDANQRAREFGLEYYNAYMRIANQLIEFDPETGEWITDSRAQRPPTVYSANITSSQEVAGMQKKNLALIEENNLLKIKNEILLDMVGEVYSEYKLSQDQQQK